MNIVTTRNATLDDLAALLQSQHAAKLDVVAPAAAIRAKDGRLLLADTDARITDTGVTPTEGEYTPTEVCDEGLAAKLGIPTGYLRRLRAEDRLDLFDANVNGWLHHAGESRAFLLRCFRSNGSPGIARAFLSDRYGILDNLDVLLAALDGVAQAGVDVDIAGCDLTERRMYMRVVAPQVKAFAPALLEGYRSPWGGQNVGGRWSPQRVAQAAQAEGQTYPPGGEPILFAGFEISNSEVGGGRFTITPRLEVQICGNGLVITADALSKVHVGARLDEGIIAWSADTQRRALGLVTGQTRDAVAHYLNPDYVKAKIDQIEAKAGQPVADAAKTVELVAKTLSSQPNSRPPSSTTLSPVANPPSAASCRRSPPPPRKSTTPTWRTRWKPPGCGHSTSPRQPSNTSRRPAHTARSTGTTHAGRPATTGPSRPLYEPANPNRAKPRPRDP